MATISIFGLPKTHLTQADNSSSYRSSQLTERPYPVSQMFMNSHDSHYYLKHTLVLCMSNHVLKHTSSHPLLPSLAREVGKRLHLASVSRSTTDQYCESQYPKRVTGFINFRAISVSHCGSLYILLMCISLSHTESRS